MPLDVVYVCVLVFQDVFVCTFFIVNSAKSVGRETQGMCLCACLSNWRRLFYMFCLFLFCCCSEDEGLLPPLTTRRFREGPALFLFVFFCLHLALVVRFLVSAHFARRVSKEPGSGLATSKSLANLMLVTTNRECTSPSRSHAAIKLEGVSTEFNLMRIKRHPLPLGDNDDDASQGPRGIRRGSPGFLSVHVPLPSSHLPPRLLSLKIWMMSMMPFAYHLLPLERHFGKFCSKSFLSLSPASEDKVTLDQLMTASRESRLCLLLLPLPTTYQQHLLVAPCVTSTRILSHLALTILRLLPPQSWPMILITMIFQLQPRRRHPDQAEVTNQDECSDGGVHI